MYKSGKVNFDEFKVALFTSDPKGNPVGFTPNVLLMPHDAFKMFDQDNSGKIDKDKFYFILYYLGIKICDKAEEKMFKKYDYDKSGYIEYKKF